ncbi:MAG TPA: 16S rRNA (cytosine(967)-C(5))-methyltransferase RsmB [Clostridiales bacterium]|nr:16S rRNA (cytosine(967)-C(5))-methyltransferase RsmB [Clostridiales bacterium]
MNLRALTLTLLTEWEEQGKYANLALSSHRMDSLTPEETARVTALFYTVTEHLLTLDYIALALAGRSGAEVRVHTLRLLRLGLSELLYLDGTPDYAAVAETVNLAEDRGEASFVNAILREAIRRRESGTLPLPDRKKNLARYLSVRYSVSLWIVKNYLRIYGEEDTEALLSFFEKHRGYDLSVNPLKISRDACLEKLIAAEIPATPFSDLSVRLSESVPPRTLPGFAEGEFHVQDGASALAVRILDPRAGERVIDVAAAPGGKSFAIAERMGDRGEVFSFDLHENKLSLIASGAARLGLTSLHIAARDGTDPDPALFGTADRVLCDLPCSGLGVLAKKPDLRYKSEEGTKELPALQKRILSASVRYLKKGGILVYSTCTLRKEENEDVVAAFLADHPDFSPVPFDAFGERWDGSMTAFPPKSGTDGFFIAKFQKNA